MIIFNQLTTEATFHVIRLVIYSEFSCALMLDGMTVAALTLAALTLDCMTVAALMLDGMTVAALTLDGMMVAALTLDGMTVAALTLDGMKVAALTVATMMVTVLTVDGTMVAATTIAIMWCTGYLSIFINIYQIMIIFNQLSTAAAFHAIKLVIYSDFSCAVVNIVHLMVYILLWNSDTLTLFLIQIKKPHIIWF